MQEDVLDALKNRPYFFDDGIRFECRRCGSCCTGEPGIVYVDDSEITRISEYLEITREILIQRFLYPFQDSYSIREAEDGRCLFFENGCSIYPVRPLQCRTFPFWFQNMRSVEAWDDVCLRCPGVGKGRLYTKEEIVETIGRGFGVYLQALREVIKGG